MNQEDLSALTDEQLLAKAKEAKSSAITHAVLIGFMAGVVIYSVAQGTWGLLTLIPLYFIYKWVGNKKEDNGLEEELKSRGLK